MIQDSMILILQPYFIVDLYIEKNHVTFVYKICQDKEDSNKNKVRRQRGLRGHASLSFKSFKFRSMSEQIPVAKKKPFRAFLFFIKSTITLRKNLRPALHSTQKTGLEIKKINFVQGPAQKTLILDQEYWPRLYPLKREKLKIYSSHF